MGLLADLTIEATELYLMRFCVIRSSDKVLVAHNRFRPLLEFADIEWAPSQPMGGHAVLATHLEPISVLTGAHVPTIETNALGFGHLFVWFPPRTHPSGDETRLMVRAGVPLKFVVQNIGVYNRDVSKYNG